MHKNHLLIILLILVLFFTSCTSFISSVPVIDKDSKFDTANKTEIDITQTENIAKFHFIDVGQGDCTLIQSGDTNILIDAGTTESGRIIYKYLKNLKIDHLDYFIGSHPHEDHLGGAALVLSWIDAETVFLNSDITTAYFYERFIDTLIDKNITPFIPDFDCVYEVGPFRIEFLSPKKDFGDTNDNSLVLTVQFGEVKALFTGDAERAVEAELIQSKADISADILKVGHHGSRYASSAEFLNAVYPGVSVIQCGTGNSYGHPHEEVLQRLENVGSAVLRTDKEGSIVLITDGKTIQKATGETYEKSEEPPVVALTYIGNIKSKVFHTEACPNLPGEKNKIVFTSREAAINLGYKECGNCNP